MPNIFLLLGNKQKLSNLYIKQTENQQEILLKSGCKPLGKHGDECTSHTDGC